MNDPKWQNFFEFDLDSRTYCFCNNGTADVNEKIIYENKYDNEWNLVSSDKRSESVKK